MMVFLISERRTIIYKDLWVKYLHREYIQSPSLFKFNKLFSDTDAQNTD